MQVRLEANAHLAILLHGAKYGAEDVYGLLLGPSADQITEAWPLFHGPVVGSLCEMAVRTAAVLTAARQLRMLGIYHSPALNSPAPPSPTPLSSFLMSRLPSSSAASSSSSSSSSSTSDRPLLLMLEPARLSSELKSDRLSPYFVFFQNGASLTKSADSSLLVQNVELASALLGPGQREVQIQALLRLTDYFDHVADLRRDFTNTALLQQLVKLLSTPQ